MYSTLTFLFNFIKHDNDLKYKSKIFLGIAYILLSKLCIVGVPLIYGKLIDALSTFHNKSILVFISLIVFYGLLRFLSALFALLQEYVFSKISIRMLRRISLKSFQQLHELSHDFHLSTNAGSLSQSIQQGIRGITNIFLSLMFGFIPLLMELIFILLIVLFAFDASFMIALLCITIAYFLPALYLTNRRLNTLRTINNGEKVINSFVVESLTNFENIKIFDSLKTEIQEFDNVWKKQEALNLQSMFQLSTLRIIQRGLLCIILMIFLVFSFFHVLEGQITIGQVVTLITYVMQLFEPLEVLSFEQDRLRYALVELESILNNFKLKPSIVDKHKASKLNIDKGNICFNSVSFGYEPHKLIFDNVSFEITAGNTTAIVGKTGVGKTTISRLLLRFYDVNSGNITIDNMDIRDLSQETLRAAVGVVPQEIVLFNNTIFHNIAYSKPGATLREVQEAARLAQLDHFIENLPNKYDTLVGERGLKLSGGEKQRLALARAILKGPKILILDEATSSLDVATEKLITDSIKQLQSHYTIILIAHRLGTITSADKIIMLEDGKVTEQGNHSELISRNKQYATWVCANSA